MSSSTPSGNLPDDVPKDIASALPADANLMKAILPPLLADFQHWFERTAQMLEEMSKLGTISVLTAAQQQDLRDRVHVAQQQVRASQVLSSATDSQAGIEMPVIMAWHKLVHECWGIAIRWRKAKQAAHE
ncbi:MAG: Protein of unknown function (DUF2605) [Phormidesmis priestleyi Ana]|uniref:DUF2605 domain-containing protein n=1 Tax=Phormidesmis priestleyi Ana TaxID=1666911 RepID=A0A0P7Z203_9CYAN|nr:MAG: Protein of unknown function (DUF2605) [Phormidesmis priestleyi Ana]